MLKFEVIKCRVPSNQNENINYNINREYLVVRCEFDNIGNNKELIDKKALDLAFKVNPHSANKSLNIRDKERLIKDAKGGVLAEYGWLEFINRSYGTNTASFTDFNDITCQIDIVLSNGKTIEVRSSFPRNGVKFAICNERYNFKNICKYNNFYKPSEINKDFFACVLFQTQKDQILNDPKIIFYLIGGSTRNMMENEKICYIDTLLDQDDFTTTEKTQYKVIRLKDALDMRGFIKYMSELGFKALESAKSNFPNII